MSKKFFCVPVITSENELRDKKDYKVIIKENTKIEFGYYRWLSKPKCFIEAFTNNPDCKTFDELIVYEPKHIENGFVIDFDPREVK